MNIFLTYRGAIGWANRKIMGCYDLPSDIDMAIDLMRSGFFTSLTERIWLAPGIILDVRGKAACSGTPAMALCPYIDRPLNIDLPEMVLSYFYYLTSFYARRPRLENALFARVPLGGGFFEPEHLAYSSILPSGFLYNSNSTDSFSANSTGALQQVSSRFTSQRWPGTTAFDLAASSSPLVAGLLLSFDDTTKDANAVKSLSESQLGGGVQSDLALPGRLVLYPDIEKRHNIRWQSWLRNLLNYYGCFKLRKKRSFASIKLEGRLGGRVLTRQKSLQPGPESPGPEKSLLELFRGEAESQPTLGPNQINTLDEILCMREAGYVSEQCDDPPPGSILSLYRGLSDPVLHPQCICGPSARKDTDKDQK